MLQQRQRLAVKSHETERQNANMTSIHCKLQEEAEKIRKWQTTSEIELKQKMAKLKECENIITNQRNQVLEKQIENEHLLAELQKEKINQAQINVKLKTARELFIALKNHSENLQTSIFRGEEDRDSLRMMAADNIKQIQEMQIKIREVVESAEKRVNTLKRCIKDKELALEDVLLASKKEIQAAKDTNAALEKEVTVCKHEIDELSRQLLDKRGHVFSLEDEIKSLKSDKDKQADEILTKASKISELNAAITDVEHLNKCAKDKVLELQLTAKKNFENFEEYKNDSERKIEELQVELTELTDSLTGLSTQYNEMTSKHDRLENENKSLKESISQLVKCVEELQEKQERCDSEINSLTDACSTAKQKELEFTELIKEKDEHLYKLNTQIECTESQLQTITDSLDGCKSKEAGYLQEIDNLNLSNAEKEGKLLELQRKTTDYDSYSKSIRSELNNKLADFQTLQERCNSLEGKNDLMTTDIASKDFEIEELASTNRALKEQVNNFLQKIQLLETEHGHLCNKISDIQTSFQSCEKEMTVLRKCVFNQKQTLIKKDEINVKLRKQLEISYKKIKDLSTSTAVLEQKFSLLADEMNESDKLALQNEKYCQDLKTHNSTLQSKVNQLVKEMEETKNVLDKKVTNSSDLQNKLFLEFQEAKSSLASKENTIEKLNNNIKQLEVDGLKELQTVISQKETMEKEIINLKKSISSKDGDISALAEEINKLQNKILKLKDSESLSISASTDQIKLLKNQIEMLTGENLTLSKELGHQRKEQASAEVLKKSLESQLNVSEANLNELQSRNSQLKSKNTTLCSEVEELHHKMKALCQTNDKLEIVTKQLNDKELQLNMANKSLEEVKRDLLVTENQQISTINSLREEIKKLNKNKVETVLSNVRKTPTRTLAKSPFTSPVKQNRTINLESPKTPTVSRSKKRRVAFGKSPSWHATSDDEMDEPDSTVSSSTCVKPDKVRCVSLKKSPKMAMHASAKSPSKLKLSKSKSPSSVTDILAKYPTPSSEKKRGVKLPDAYLKRKEANKKKQKIKVETRSWFDSDSAFGFDEC